MRIRKGDIVEIIAGADLGKRGKVLSMIPTKNRAVVEGINFVYKHRRPTRDDPQGGRIQREASMHLSNLLPVCGRCNRGVRVGRGMDRDSRRIRVCIKCGEALAK